jgi:hypothetical protein
LLLQSSQSDLWKKSVENDLQGFGVRLILKEVNPVALKAWARELDNKYIEALQKIRIKVDGKSYPVDQLPIDAAPELKAAVNSLYADYLNGRSKIDTIIADITRSRSYSSCTSTPIDSVLQNMGEAVDSFKAQLLRYKNVDVVWSGEGNFVSPGSAFYDSLISLVVLEKGLKDLKDKIDEISKDEKINTLFERMVQLDQLIRDEIANENNPLKSITDMQEYNRFSKYALSFAMLSEPKDSIQVKAVLKQLALPPVSFGVKREPDVKKVMITAYFGAQAGTENGGKGYGGLTVPVGVEYSYGLRNGGVVSMMLAPFDFAHPVNQIISKNTDNSTLKDIVSPGIYFAYGFKKYPLIVGAGVSRGTSLTQLHEENSVMYFVFVGMDMPLFGFY